MAETRAPSRWSTASTQARSAAAWLATAAGAAAAVVFGAGPILDPDTDPSAWEWWRWAVVIGLALVGAGSVIYVIGRLLSLQVPLEITLDRLPPKLTKRIEENDLGEYLPDDTASIEQFKERLQAFSVAAVSLDAEAAAEDDPDEKARLTRLATIQQHNRDIYSEKREELYELAAYELEAERLTPMPTKRWFALAGAGVAAAVSMVAFTLLASSPGNEEDDDAVAIPTVGELLKNDLSEPLWSRLDLAVCEMDDVVPVVVHNVADDKVTVQTLGVPGECGRFKFTVAADLITLVVVEPEEIEINLEGDSLRTDSDGGPTQ